MTASKGPSVMKRSCRAADCLRHQRRHHAKGSVTGAASALEKGAGWDIEKSCGF